MEWVRLQFVPNYSYTAAAGKFTDRLKVEHGVQTQSLKKQHPDQYWVSALTKYYLGFVPLVELLPVLLISFWVACLLIVDLRAVEGYPRAMLVGTGVFSYDACCC